MYWALSRLYNALIIISSILHWDFFTFFKQKLYNRRAWLSTSRYIFIYHKGREKKINFELITQKNFKAPTTTTTTLPLALPSDYNSGTWPYPSFDPILLYSNISIQISSLDPIFLLLLLLAIGKYALVQSLTNAVFVVNDNFTVPFGCQRIKKSV